MRALLLLVLVMPLWGQDWFVYRPKLRSATTALGLDEARRLLAGVCESIGWEGRRAGRREIRCHTRQPAKPQPQWPGPEFFPARVIYGHFLGRESEDAVVSGRSNETARQMGGTLLLTRRGGVWTPLWYEEGLLTKSCEKLLRPDGGQTLLCEREERSNGMGTWHALYALDLREKGKNRRLLDAHTFESNICWGQTQTLTPLTWSAQRREFSVGLRTPLFAPIPEISCDRPPRPPRLVTHRFAMSKDGVVVERK